MASTPLQAGDKVMIKDTATTKGHGIAGGPGLVDRVMGEDIYVLYIDRTFGPSGPYKLTSNDVEKAN